MVKCVVTGCPNRMVNVNRGAFSRAPKRFFHFPKDPGRVKVWLAALRETDKQDLTDQHFICEDHFLPEDVSVSGIKSDAIPIMPPYLDGPLGPASPWGGASSEDEEQWGDGCCEDKDADEGGEDAPPAPEPHQNPAEGLEDPPETLNSRAASQQVQPRKVIGHKDPAGMRSGVTLGLLTRQLLERMLAAPGGSLDLGQAAVSLQAHRHRVQDVVTVLDDINLVQKESLNRIKWIGQTPISSFLRKNREKLLTEVENMKLVEETLDSLIESCSYQLFSLTDDAEDSALAYVSHKDICQLEAFRGQTVIVIKAPEETKLEIPSPREDNIQIHLQAGTGPIMVQTCDLDSADKTNGLFLTLEESRISTVLDTESSCAQSI